jgi:pimeloyl-ACP methyl ester carboxylesterase
MNTLDSSEEIVWIESEDGLPLDGIVIRPVGVATKPIAVVHVHGFTSRFTLTTHVLVGRHLARHGFTSVSGSNRGYSFGKNTQRRGTPVMIGAAWERFDECPLDIGAWVAFVVRLGFDDVVLLGHSFGVPKVVWYQAERQDPRVRGLICASPGPAFLVAYPEVVAKGDVAEPRPFDMHYLIDPAVIDQAERMVHEGRGQDLLPWGSVGSITLSAQTCLDRAAANRATFDVLGIATAAPAVARVRCPLLVFFGTEEAATMGGAAELDLIRRNAVSASRVDTHIVEGADHMYTERTTEVAELIAGWLEILVARLAV